MKILLKPVILNSKHKVVYSQWQLDTRMNNEGYSHGKKIKNLETNTTRITPYKQRTLQIADFHPKMGAHLFLVLKEMHVAYSIMISASRFVCGISSILLYYVLVKWNKQETPNANTAGYTDARHFLWIDFLGCLCKNYASQVLFALPNISPLSFTDMEL